MIEEIKSYGVHCQSYSCDFSNLIQAEQFIARVLADFDDVELLINSAANFIQENLEKTPNGIL
ncbi:MAG: hypothetical protein Ct9H300mP23_05970 [Nitrospinota bacterium]|nr:MAG: hypothetical protein Ct9H300mP23_05970 [Nitrospinota bacterium]